jgi:CheY-like chemotaxis protein
MNLAVNAQDAMPDGGILTIQTGLTQLDQVYATANGDVRPGPYVMLAVSDTGCGIDAEIHQHLFEPFFTTKSSEKGTGLGLAIVYGIIKQHGGHIWVYSEPHQGATFKIYLPVSEIAQSERQELPVTPAANLSGSETILLVEDDRQVRQLSQVILNKQGYRVLVAKNGPQALAVLAGHTGPVHLLLADVVLPGMNGRELFNQLSEQLPTLKVLYMSGYTDEVIAHRGVLEEGVNFIQKPFSVHALAAKVREVLDEDDAPPRISTSS